MSEIFIPYSEFEKLFNKRLFDGSRSSLLQNIALRPERFIGLFRPTKPATKLVQNITQSHEIKFGDALEEVFEKYFALNNFSLLDKRMISSSGEEFNVDQLFSKDGVVYMIEQKVRDDHDSTKKRGQFQNFESKYHEVSKIYIDCIVIPIMWFVDKSLVKNKNYYLGEMQKMNEAYACNASLFYGEELFLSNVIKKLNSKIWDEFLAHLQVWKNFLPDMPEINFDNSSDEVFDEIKDLPPAIIRRLFSNKEVKAQILPIIFPVGTTLNKVCAYFLGKELPIYKNLAREIKIFIESK